MSTNISRISWKSVNSSTSSYSRIEQYVETSRRHLKIFRWEHAEQPTNQQNYEISWSSVRCGLKRPPMSPSRRNKARMFLTKILFPRISQYKVTGFVAQHTRFAFSWYLSWPLGRAESFKCGKSLTESHRNMIWNILFAAEFRSDISQFNLFLWIWFLFHLSLIYSLV
jgi:hypothetical protein